MIAVIFEVWPAEGRKGDYMELAQRLRDDLVQMDGFISVERFQSLTEPDKLLVAVLLARRAGGRRLAQSWPASRDAGQGPSRDFPRLSAAGRFGGAGLRNER